MILNQLSSQQRWAFEAIKQVRTTEPKSLTFQKRFCLQIKAFEFVIQKEIFFPHLNIYVANFSYRDLLLIDSIIQLRIPDVCSCLPKHIGISLVLDGWSTGV